MGLVGYSDSEASSDEVEQPKQPQKPSAAPKTTVRKVVDSSNPRKIVVNLPEVAKGNSTTGEESEEPPAKKARVGGGMSGFNAMLPAPKRANAASTGGGPVKGPSKGLGSGVNLKTGANPGFSREPVASSQFETEELQQPTEMSGNDAGLETDGSLQTQNKEPEKEPVKMGNPMMFKPLSVARNTKKKKPNPSATSQSHVAEDNATTSRSKSQSHPNSQESRGVSLFSFNANESDLGTAAVSIGEYKPMLYQTRAQGTAEDPEQQASIQQPSTAQQPSQFGPQSLDSIASDLNLSASARRQLFGRGGQGAEAVSVMKFNADDEWKANEELRANGEQQVHNPVRAIAPGKHSLKQLVSQVTNQREALEDSFASGRRTKAESGSKYGW